MKLKRRWLSLAMSALMLSAIPTPYIYAADDLSALASSLGSDTDFLNIPYIWETTIGAEGKKAYYDKSYYSTTVAILVHNGVLKASDLQENAAYTADITDSAALRERIKKECEKLDNSMVYGYSFKNDKAENKVRELISAAENACKNKKYFHIGYRGLSPEFEPDTSEEYEAYLTGHFAVGIGITEGAWTFGGKSFDRCILTLDGVNTAAGNAVFSENTCIYVNSATCDIYIPKYSETSENLRIIAVEGDDMINGITSDMYRIQCINKRPSSDFTITTRKDGIETVRNDENDFLDYCHNAYNGNFVLKADDIKVECESYNYSGSGIVLRNRDMHAEAEFSAGKSVFTFDGSVYSMRGTYYPEYVSPAGSEMHDSFMCIIGDNTFDLYGRLLDGFSFEPVGNDFILNPDSTIALSLVMNEKAAGNIFVSRKTKIHMGSDGMEFFIDVDGDGEFEHRAENGDVNCDGVVDARDASLVLQDYSALSTGGASMLSKSLADCNGDGMINASDGSFILRKYAELSTS